MTDDKPLTAGQVLELMPSPKRRKPAQKTKKRNKSVTNAQIAEVLVATKQGMTQKDIADKVGVHYNTVRNIQGDFRQLFENMDEVQSFRTVRADILDAIDLTLLKSMLSPEKHDKATLAQLAFAHSKLYESSRLERNLSTANVAQTVRFTEVNLSPIESSLPVITVKK